MKTYTQFPGRRPIHPGKSFAGVRSLTDPQFRDECSINGIIARYGVVPPPPVKPLYGDVSQFGDFSECMDKVNDAISAFNSLPSSIRSRFGNDPRSYYDFVSSPGNTDECVRLGIRVAPEVAPDPVKILEEIRDGVTRKGASSEAVAKNT